MGSGKTSVAKELKKIFPEYELIEIDFLIAQKEGILINRIFETKGEKYFRQVEKSMINDILKKDNQIISLGGGSLENDFDFALAQKNSILFYLSANVEVLYNRIKDNKDRPLLACDNPQKKLADLLAKREINYKKADFVIDVNNVKIDDVAMTIAGIYNNGNN